MKVTAPVLALALVVALLGACLPGFLAGSAVLPLSPNTGDPLARHLLASPSSPDSRSVSAASSGPPSALASGATAGKQMHLVPISSLTPLTGNLTPTAPTSGTIAQFTLAKGGPSLNFFLDVPFARPFQVQNLSAILYLESINGNAIFLDINITVYDWNGVSLAQVVSQQWRIQTNNVAAFQRFTFVFAPVNFTFPQGDQVRLQILNANTSDNSAILGVDAVNVDSQLDVLTTTYVNIDTLALRDAKGGTTVWSPKDSLVIQANVSDPFGSREIAGARLNVTDPLGNHVRAWYLMGAMGNGTAWTLYQTKLSPPLSNGTYSVRVVALEKNGVTKVANATALVRAPAFTFQKIATVAQAKAGNRFSYYVYYNNTGTGPAGRVWINDTVPAALTFLSSTPAPNSVVGQNLSWAFASVPPGNHSIQISVRVLTGTSGVAYVRNWASLNYTDEKGYRWPMRMSYTDVVVNGPVLRLAVSSVPAILVHSNQTVVQTISFTNSGDAAQTVWVNLTLPPGLGYVSDTSASRGGVRSSPGPGVEAFRFVNMPAGTSIPVTWSFTLTALAGPNLVFGTPLNTTVALNCSSVNGLWMPEQVRTIPLTAASPAIPSAAVDFASPTAVPNQLLHAFVNFTNVGNEPAGTVWINLTLDPFLQFLSASVPATVSGGSLRLTMTSAPVGTDSVSISVSAIPYTPDRRTLAIWGNLDYTDGYGNQQPAVTVLPGLVTIAESFVTFQVTPANLTVEAGSRITYALTGSNAGSGPASTVWLTLSLPSSLDYGSDDFGVSPSRVGSNYTWVWRSFAPGVHLFSLGVNVTSRAGDRSRVDLLFQLESTDMGGNLQNATSFRTRVNVVAPILGVNLFVDRANTTVGGTFTYTLRAQNVGSTAAHLLWLTDTIDDRLEVITYTASVQATGTRTLNWTFLDLQPGQTVVVSILVKVVDRTPAGTIIPDVAEARYTNSAGGLLGYVRSTPVRVEVAADLLPLVYILLGGSGIGAVAVLVVHRRYRVQIEDVFLIYRDGILISHLSRSLVQDKDEDQLSGMITAVQEFVRDSFTYGEHRELHQMEFGDYHILIERGSMVYLAVVYAGKDSGLIRKKVRRVLDQVETSFGAVLAKWDGDMQAVVGTRDLLRDSLLLSRRPWFLRHEKAG